MREFSWCSSWRRSKESEGDCLFFWSLRSGLFMFLPQEKNEGPISVYLGFSPGIWAVGS